MTGAGALAVAGALVVYAPLHADRLESVPAGISALGALMLAVAIVARFRGLVVWALAVLAGGYVVALLLRSGTIDGEAPLYAAGLLVCAELSFWSMELQLPADPGITGRRASRVVLLALIGGGVSALVLAVSELAWSGGLGLEALGVAAAAAALVLVALLARSAAGRPVDASEVPSSR